MVAVFEIGKRYRSTEGLVCEVIRRSETERFGRRVTVRYVDPRTGRAVRCCERVAETETFNGETIPLGFVDFLAAEDEVSE